MKTVTVISGEKFSLESHGNGWAYTLRRRSDRMSIWFQDDDAHQFRERLEHMESAAFPSDRYDDILEYLWSEYSNLASPDE